MSKEGKILFSAYFCDPFLKSEAYSAFKWLIILLDRYKVILLTTEEYKKDILIYFNSNLPVNLEIIGINDNFPFKNTFHRHQLFFGYFVFIYKAYFLVKKKKEIYNEINVIFHRNPCSFRYFTLFHKLNLPLVIGPLSGGLKPPKELRSYFKKEKFFNKLRQFDNLLLKIPIYKKQYEKADQILVTSTYINEIIPFISPNKTKVILETAVDCPLHLDYKNVMVNKCVEILFVGRLVRYKGIELILYALSNLKQYDFLLHIAGEGIEMANLKKVSEKLGLNKKIIFHGQIDTNDVQTLFKQSDIFCFPTLKEAAGNVLLEAMSFGLPIITVNYGGPKEICPATGSYKLQLGDINSMIQELTTYLEMLIKNPDLRTKMGHANYEYCKMNYNWPIIGEDIINIFQPYF